jgi:hypothetical protein
MLSVSLLVTANWLFLETLHFYKNCCKVRYYKLKRKGQQAKARFRELKREMTRENKSKSDNSRQKSKATARARMRETAKAKSNAKKIGTLTIEITA